MRHDLKYARSGGGYLVDFDLLICRYPRAKQHINQKSDAIQGVIIANIEMSIPQMAYLRPLSLCNLICFKLMKPKTRLAIDKGPFKQRYGKKLPSRSNGRQ